VLRPRQRVKLATGAQDKEQAMSQKLNAAMTVIGIDIGELVPYRGPRSARCNRAAAEVLT
jgi:hypothetical protein